jgi:adenylate cyclase
VEQYEEAAEVLRRCVRAAPDWRPLQVWLAAACAQMGSMDEARIAAQHVRRIEPAFTIARWVGFEPYARPQDAGKIAEGLRKAGLPEH